MPRTGIRIASLVALLAASSCGGDDSNTQALPKAPAADGAADASVEGAAGSAGSGVDSGIGGAAGASGSSGSAGVSGAAGAPDPGCAPSASDPAFPKGSQLVTHPFRGVTVFHRATQDPRPLSYEVVRIDPSVPGLRFRLTPQNGPSVNRETTRQTTLAFLLEQKAQLAFNAHFFTPWPAVDPWSELEGIGASDGDVYSEFDKGHLSGINFAQDNKVTYVHWADGDTTGLKPDPTVSLYNTVGAGEQIVTNRKNTATWKALEPRTTLGVTSTGQAIMFLADGRQDKVSEGMSTLEIADLMIQEWDVVDALNLDGGGSTTLAIADPDARVVNVPSGGSLRSVGSNLAVFADACRSGKNKDLLVYEPFDYAHRDWGASTALPAGGGLKHLLGGTGWAGDWRDSQDGTRFNGIAVYPGDAGGSGDSRSKALSYTDASNAVLQAKGAQARTSFGASSASLRYLDVSQIDPSLLTAEGRLGVDGTTLWLSFLAQGFDDAGGERWAWVSLGEAVRFGKVGDASGNWGVQDSKSGKVVVGTISSDKVVFLVAKIEFQAGEDKASVWLNPPLGAEPSSGALSLALADFKFYSVQLEGRYSTDFDEIRLGTTFASVAPITQ